MNIWYSKAFAKPRLFAKYFLSSLYPLVIRFYQMPKVLSISDTIKILIENKGSIARFGDSEFLYIIEKIDLPYQRYDMKLANKLILILKNKNEKIYVGLPSGYYGLDNLIDESIHFWKAQITLIYPRLYKFITKESIYLNASMTRIYYEIKNKDESKYYFEIIRKIWDKRDVIIIEGEKSRLGVGNDLFENASSINRILGPAVNAFEKVDLLVSKAMEMPKDSLFLIAMGPTAKVIAFELANCGRQAIDIGNIDIEYEWSKRNVTKKEKVIGKYTSEASGGRIVEDIYDEKYINQIIGKFI
jgi:glycosyltransferase family protein